jgi:hypothetical protein
MFDPYWLGKAAGALGLVGLFLLLLVVSTQGGRYADARSDPEFDNQISPRGMKCLRLGVLLLVLALLLGLLALFAR